MFFLLAGMRKLHEIWRVGVCDDDDDDDVASTSMKINYDHTTLHYTSKKSEYIYILFIDFATSILMLWDVTLLPMMHGLSL